MRKIFMCLFLFVLALSFSAPAWALETEAFPPLVKLGRGLANVVTCPLEVPKNMGDANQANGIFASMTWGLLQGVADTLIRGVVGVYEVATFPIPFPQEYAPILTDPEYFLPEAR
jgi:putative exosortase-associated protein (TIGR04073 family)